MSEPPEIPVLPVPEADTPLPLEPPPPRRTPLRALGEMALCSGVPTQLVLGSLLVRLGLGGGGATLTLSFVALLSLADTVVLIALMLWFLRTRGPSPRHVWWGTRPLVPEIVSGILTSPMLLFGVGLVLLAVQRLAPWLHNVAENPLETIARGSVSNAILLGVVGIVAGAVREELQRAFLMDRFERHVGPTWLAVLVLSVAFGLGHALQGWDAVVATAVLGAFWAIVYVRRRSVVAPLVSHAIFNSLEIARMLALQS